MAELVTSRRNGTAGASRVVAGPNGEQVVADAPLDSDTASLASSLSPDIFQLLKENPDFDLRKFPYHPELFPFYPTGNGDFAKHMGARIAHELPAPELPAPRKVLIDNPDVLGHIGPVSEDQAGKRRKAA